jgi:hypothetical protein
MSVLSSARSNRLPLLVAKEEVPTPASSVDYEYRESPACVLVNFSDGTAALFDDGFLYTHQNDSGNKRWPADTLEDDDDRR